MEWDSVNVLVRGGSASNGGSNAVTCRLESYCDADSVESTGVLTTARLRPQLTICDLRDADVGALG
jgi:hypothetical protein